MSDLILDLVEQRASGVRKGRPIYASCMPESIIYSSELSYFSDFEVDIIGVEVIDGEHISHGGHTSVREALTEGCDYAYFHVKGRSKRDVDADSPWYPLHDTKSDEEAYKLETQLDSYIRSALNKVA